MMEPTIVDTSIGSQYFFKISQFLYIGIASETVKGPSIKLIIFNELLYVFKLLILSLLSIKLIKYMYSIIAMDVSINGCKIVNFVFLYTL